MREILFRGKKKDSGEWVCGDLIQLHEEASYWYILPEGISSEMYEDEPYHFRQNDVMCSVALAKIIPETVGQFTGLTDKNGKKIFEGDIIRFEDNLYIVQRECDTLGGYWAETGYILKQIGWDDYIHFTDTIDDWCNEMIVFVVGNKWDNPELLGE